MADDQLPYDKLPHIPSEMPLRIPASNQAVSGLVIITRLQLRIKITVKAVDSGEERTLTRVVPAPLDEFCNALEKWCAGLVYPARPRVRTWNLDAAELEPYCLLYRQAFELMRRGKALTEFRTQLWRSYKDARQRSGRPIGKGESGRAERQNFIDALDAFLKDWIDNKERDPYGER